MIYEKPSVIIICAGDAKRWNDYLGVPKHFATVDGEPIIKRTVRLASKYDCNISIIAKTNEYSIEGASLYKPKLDRSNGDADKFISSRNLWSENGRTIILYGDVFFTEEAIHTIFEYPHPDWRLFGRAFASSFTGGNHGECFGISFYHDFIPEFDAALRRTVKLYKDGLIDRCGGWEVYKAMIRLPDEVFYRHFAPLVGEKFTHIDDWTEDFDWQSDYDEFTRRFHEKNVSA